MREVKRNKEKLTNVRAYLVTYVMWMPKTKKKGKKITKHTKVDKMRQTLKGEIRERERECTPTDIKRKNK